MAGGAFYVVKCLRDVIANVFANGESHGHGSAQVVEEDILSLMGGDGCV